MTQLCNTSFQELVRSETFALLPVKRRDAASPISQQFLEHAAKQMQHTKPRSSSVLLRPDHHTMFVARHSTRKSPQIGRSIQGAHRMKSLRKDFQASWLRIVGANEAPWTISSRRDLPCYVGRLLQPLESGKIRSPAQILKGALLAYQKAPKRKRKYRFSQYRLDRFAAAAKRPQTCQTRIARLCLCHHFGAFWCPSKLPET